MGVLLQRARLRRRVVLVVVLLQPADGRSACAVVGMCGSAAGRLCDLLTDPAILVMACGKVAQLLGQRRGWQQAQNMYS